MVRPDIMTDFYKYAHRYCAPTENRWCKEFNGAANTEELHYILDRKVMLRRLKSEVLHDLPAKIRQRIVVSTDSVITRSIAHMLKINFGSKHDREHLEQVILRRSNMFAETGRIETGKFLSEIPKDLRCQIEGDPEQKGIAQAFKMSGEAKIKGVKEFLDNIFISL